MYKISKSKIVFLLLFLVLILANYLKAEIASPTDQVSEQEIILSEEDFAPPQPPHLPTTDSFANILRVITSLFIIIAIAFALSWFLQKKGGFGKNIYGKVLGILPLDNKRFVYLVDIMGKILILGVTEQNINLLGEITDKDTVDSLRFENSSAKVAGMDKFFSFLKKDEQAQQSSETDFTANDLSNQNARNKERLRKINELLVKRGSSDSQTDK